MAIGNATFLPLLCKLPCNHFCQERIFVKENPSISSYSVNLHVLNLVNYILDCASYSTFFPCYYLPKP